MVSKQPISRFIVVITALCALLATPASFAQIYATVSKNRLTQNELFQLRIVSDKKVSGNQLDLSVLDNDFQILGRPSFGTSLNIINGTRTTRSEWNINIAAKHTGVITLPAFTIDGESSQPIALQVVKDATLPNNQDLVSITTHFDELTLYPKQSTIMHVELVIKADTRGLQDPQITPPSAQGVQLESAAEPIQSQQIINGIQSTVVKQDFRITALKPGSFSVTEPQFAGQLLYSGYNGDTRIVPLQTKAQTFTISVMDKPSQYQGVWLPTSYLNLTQQWQDSAGKVLSGDHQQTMVGDPLTRIITLVVRGVSQEQVPTITVDYPSSLRVYSEKPAYQALDNGDLSVTVKQVLIPNQSGDISIPGVTLNWWDTKAQTERKSILSSLTLQVAKQPGSAPALATPPVIAANPKENCPVVTSAVDSENSKAWRYLTFTFATLWLATLLVWFYRNSGKTTAKSEPGEKPTELFSALQQAIKDNDGFKVNALMTEWVKQRPLTEEQRVQLEQTKQQWFEQRYSNNHAEVEQSTLLQLVIQINKTTTKKKIKTDDELPPL